MFKFKTSDRVKDSAKPNYTKAAPIRVSEDKPFEFGFVFEIDNIKTVKYDESIHSLPCVVHDLTWKIMVRKNKKKETLGFFLQCEPVSRNFEGYWSCYAIATFTIVNKKNSSNNLSRETKHLFCERESDWGYTSFHVLNELYNSNLVVSNSVKFQVSVKAYTPDFFDINAENSEDEVNGGEYHIESTMNYLKSEMNLFTTNLRTEMNSFKTDLRKDFAEMNLLPTNLRTEMSSFKTDLRKDVATMNSLLATNLQTEISSFKTDLRKDLVKMMKEICDDVVAQIDSEGDDVCNRICVGEEKRKTDEKIKNAENTEVMNKSVMTQFNAVVGKIPEKIRGESKEGDVDTVVRESPKIVEEKKMSKIAAVAEEIPVKVGKQNMVKVNTAAIEISEPSNKDSVIAAIDKGQSVDEVLTEEPENSVDDFEIVSCADGKNVDCKNSDASSSFEMILEDICDDNQTFCISEKTANSDLVIDIFEEHFANESTEPSVITVDLTHLADSVESSFLEILEAPVEDVLKDGTKSISAEEKKEHLKDTVATNERKTEKKSSETEADAFDSSYRKWADDLVQSSPPQVLLCKDSKHHSECRKTSSVLNSPYASSELPQVPNYWCHGESYPPCD